MRSQMMPKGLIELGGFFLFTLVLRFSTLFATAIDQDEGIYFLIAQSFLEGHPPYVELWDNKPPGTFFLFAIAMLIFGNSPVSMRWLAIICTTLTSYFLCKIGKTLDQKYGDKVGLVAGGLYAIFSLHNDGDATNAEILFAPFVSLAFLLLFQGIKTQFSQLRVLMIGLSLGLALQIKYVVIMDIIALGMVAGFGRFKDKVLLNQDSFKFYLTLTVGLILPFMGVILYYFQVNHLQDYFYATITANGKYVKLVEFEIEDLVSRLIKQFYDNLLLWIGLIISIVYLTIPQKLIKLEKHQLVKLLIWCCVTFIAVLLSKRFYNHYFLQLLPPLSLMTAYVLVKLTHFEPIKQLKNRTLILGMILLYPFSQSLYNRTQKSVEFISNQWIKGIKNWDDREQTIADYLKERVQPEDYIYVVNYQPILYALVPAKIPTKYAFPSHLTSLSQILPIEPINELNSIMNHRPVYIILADKDNIDSSYRDALDEYLENRYFLEIEIENVKLYRLEK